MCYLFVFLSGYYWRFVEVGYGFVLFGVWLLFLVVLDVGEGGVWVEGVFNFLY